MKTLDAITILDHFACALEALRQRNSFHNMALELSECLAGALDAATFNERIVRPREDPASCEE